MTLRECSIPDCAGRIKARGWCDKHWKRWRVHGDPLTVNRLQASKGVPLATLTEWVRSRDRSTGCWVWPFGTDDRYGTLVINGRDEGMHRAAAILDGLDPTGLCVCHKCDNMRCCNPDHLFLGSQADNLADMKRKGRLVGAPAKVTDAEVSTIRQMYADGGNQYQIAVRFGISQSHVSALVNGLHR